MHIREAKSDDREDIQSVYWSAFSEDEREMVAKLAVDLLFEDAALRVISLLAEVEGRVVGHTAYSPVTIDGNETFHGYIMAPLGVALEHQKRGIGSRLIQSGMQRLSEMGVDMLFVYGDPNYYRKFGFSAEAAERYVPPYELQFPFGWQGVTLNGRCSDSSTVIIACVSSLSDPALW